MFGNMVMEEVTQNLPLVPSFNPILTKMTVGLVAVNPITKYSLSITPVNFQIQRSLKDTCSMPNFVARVVACTISAVIILNIAIFYPGFHNVMALLGSFFSFTISVVFPELCYLKLYGHKLTMAERTFEILIMFMGAFFGIVGTIGVFLN